MLRFYWQLLIRTVWEFWGCLGAVNVILGAIALMVVGLPGPRRLLHLEWVRRRWAVVALLTLLLYAVTSANYKMFQEQQGADEPKTTILSARALDAGQKDHLRRVLREAKGPTKVIILGIDGDSEAERYKQDFQDVFGALGWNSKREDTLWQVQLGLQIVEYGDCPAVKALAGALRELSVPFRVVPAASLPFGMSDDITGGFLLIVGLAQPTGTSYPPVP